MRLAQREGARRRVLRELPRALPDVAQLATARLLPPLNRRQLYWQVQPRARLKPTPGRSRPSSLHALCMEIRVVLRIVWNSCRTATMNTMSLSNS
jgi:hypothetical protein